MAALRETKELTAQLAKADETDADRCIDLIAALAAVSMNYEVLAESKVGSSVKPFKKAADAKLAAAATALLKSWRAIADQHASSVQQVTVWGGLALRCCCSSSSGPLLTRTGPTRGGSPADGLVFAVPPFPLGVSPCASRAALFRSPVRGGGLWGGGGHRRCSGAG